jgi:hypothetical protein
LRKKKRNRNKQHPQQQNAGTPRAAPEDQPHEKSDNGEREQQPADSLSQQSMWSRVIESLNELTIQRLGLVVAAGLLIATWYQSCLTRDALKETREEFTAHQRPYVSLGRKDGTIEEFVEPKTATDLAGLKIYSQNGGPSPALNPHVGILMALILNATGTGPEAHPYQPHLQPFRQLLRYRLANGSTGENGSAGSIPPQSEYVSLIPELLSDVQLISMKEGKRTMVVMGELEYCDEVGTYSCRSFTLFFQGPPINSFSETTESDCAAMYGYPPRQPGQTYLLPCEQPSERQQRQEQERQEIVKRAADAPIVSPTPTPSPN